VYQRFTGGCRQSGGLHQSLVKPLQFGVVERPVGVLRLGCGQPAGDDGEQPEARGQEMGQLVAFGLA